MEAKHFPDNIFFEILTNGTLQKNCVPPQGVPKNVLIECCWSHGAQAQSPVVGTTWAWKVFFWSFLTKTKQDQAPPSHVQGKIWPDTALNIGYDFVL